MDGCATHTALTLYTNPRSIIHLSAWRVPFLELYSLEAVYTPSSSPSPKPCLLALPPITVSCENLRFSSASRLIRRLKLAAGGGAAALLPELE